MLKTVSLIFYDFFIAFVVFKAKFEIFKLLELNWFILVVQDYQHSFQEEVMEVPISSLPSMPFSSFFLALLDHFLKLFLSHFY